MVALNKFFQRVSWDLVGFSTSALCAIHCLAFPMLLLFGGIGGSFVHNHTFENAILFVSAVVGLTSLVPSLLNHHRKATPVLIFIGGFILIVISRFSVPALWETILTTSGASAIAFAHYVNWRYCRSACAPQKANAKVD